MANRGKTLFEWCLRDMYDAEHRFIDALQTMLERAHDTQLADALHRHQLMTRGQVRRLEQCFEAIGATAKREHCAAGDGLVKEYQSFVKKQKPDAQTLDAYAAAAALKTEHYEIASYEAMVDLAKRLGLDRCVDLLNDTLNEEKHTAEEFEAVVHQMDATITDTKLGFRDTAEALRSTARTGGLAAVGKAMRDQATGTVEEAFEFAGSTLGRLEERGRRARAGTKRTARSPSRRPASRAKNGRKKTSPRRTTSARKPAARRKTTARRTSTRKRATTRKRARAGSR